MERIKSLWQSRKLAKLQAWRVKRFVDWAIATKYYAEQILIGRGCSIKQLWKVSATAMLTNHYEHLINGTLSTLEFSRESSWTIFQGRLISCEENSLDTLIIPLLHSWLRELTLKGKVCKPFWTPAYNGISERLLSPIETENSSNSNRNPSRVSFSLSTSTAVENWVNGIIPKPTKPPPKKAKKAKEEQLKTLKLLLKPTKEQQKFLDEWLNTSRYLYNKTVHRVNNPRFRRESKIDVRDRYVTSDTRKTNQEYAAFAASIKVLGKRKLNGEDNESVVQELADVRKQLQNLSPTKNSKIKDWELNTPKDIRGAAVFDVFNARDSAMTNLSRGNIRRFSLGYRKKTAYSDTMLLPHSAVKVNKDGDLVIYPGTTKASKVFILGKRTKKRQAKDLRVEYDVRISKEGERYYILVPVAVKMPDATEEKKTENYCGIDPGTRTFMTCFGNKGITEIDTPTETLKAIRDKIKGLKNKQFRTARKEKASVENRKFRVRKRTMNRLDRRMRNVVDNLHWQTINTLLKTNDVLFYGDIKSHDIVKRGSIRGVNRAINEVKFYQFKTRLQYKAKVLNKLVVTVDEAYTTKTCSFCGSLNDPKASKTYHCINCKRTMGRDTNAAKNILMKGIIKGE